MADSFEPSALNSVDLDDANGIVPDLVDCA